MLKRLARFWPVLLVPAFAIGAATPWFASGDAVRAIKSNLNLAGLWELRNGTAVPTTTAQSALQGSIYCETGAAGGLCYTKQNAGSTTDWFPFFYPDPCKYYFVKDDFSAVNGTAVGELNWEGLTQNNGDVMGGQTDPASTNHSVVGLRTDIATNGTAGIDLTNHIWFGTGIVVFRAIVYIDTLSDATNEYDIRVGFCDTAAFGDCSDGLYFEYDRNTSANWLTKAANAGTRSSTTTSTAVVAGSWLTMTIVVAADRTSTFYVNQTSIGTMASTNVPASDTRGTGPAFAIEKSAGTTSRIMYVDYFDLRIALTTARCGGPL